MLEPATFGVPIVIGPNYFKFNEAIELIKEEAFFSVDKSRKLSVLLKMFFSEKQNRISASGKLLIYVVGKT